MAVAYSDGNIRLFSLATKKLSLKTSNSVNEQDGVRMPITSLRWAPNKGHVEILSMTSLDGGI